MPDSSSTIPQHTPPGDLRRSIRRHLLALDDTDTSFHAELLDSFLDTAETLLDDLKTHCERQNADGLHTAAHTLKSSAQVVGLLHLAALCKSLEMKTLNRPFSDELIPHVAAIEVAYRAAHDDLLFIRDDSR